MKLAAFGLLMMLGLALAKPQQYTTKYDNVDLEQILHSDRLLKNYINCLLDRGNCSPDGLELKSVLPDALETECSKCSEKQKNGSRKVLRYLIKEKPELWKELEAKYDKDGKYRKKYEAEAKKEGIKLN